MKSISLLRLHPISLVRIGMVASIHRQRLTHQREDSERAKDSRETVGRMRPNYSTAPRKTNPWTEIETSPPQLDEEERQSSVTMKRHRGIQPMAVKSIEKKSPVMRGGCYHSQVTVLMVTHLKMLLDSHFSIRV